MKIKNRLALFLIALFASLGSSFARASDNLPTQDKSGRWKGSLMFPITDIRRLEEVMEAYEASIANKDHDDDFLKNLIESINTETPLEEGENIPQVVLPSIAPSFYLSSIVYVSDNEWAVWIDGEKFTHNRDKNIDKNLTITSVNKTSVELEWETKHIDHISPNWKHVMEETEQAISIVSKNGNIVRSGEQVESTQIIYFTLHPNQTFVTNAMEIMEGKVEHVIIRVEEPETKTTDDAIENIAENN